MGSHRVHGGRRPRHCRERFRRRSGLQPPRPCRTTRKWCSCSWPLLSFRWFARLCIARALCRKPTQKAKPGSREPQDFAPHPGRESECLTIRSVVSLLGDHNKKRRGRPMTDRAAEQHSPDWLGLGGRVCVVTGGGGGIGRAVAVNLAHAGAHVAVIDRDEQGLEKTRGELPGNRHVIAPCDVTNADSIKAASETIEKALGPAGVLVNAAAILRPGSLDTLSLAEWNMVISVNLTGYFLCAQIFGA